VFKDKEPLWEYCHKLIEEITEGDELLGEHAFFAFALLSNHPVRVPCLPVQCAT
jgi:hypothetical protein